jgi:hypothetical protein
VSNAAEPGFAGEDIGKTLRIVEGTGFYKGCYAIEAVDSGGFATLDRICGVPGSNGVGERVDAPVLRLPIATDMFEITVDGDVLKEVGVIYLRAVRS